MGLNNIEDRKKDGHSACWRLFNISYLVNTTNKYFHVISKETCPIRYDTQVFNLYGMTEDDFNERYSNYNVRVSLPVPTLVELNKVGAPIGFSNSDDAHAIYLDIQEHFDDWIRFLSNPFIRREPPPFSDFVDLDDFARNVFSVSRDIVRNIEDRRVKTQAQIGLKKWLNITSDDYEYIEQYPSKLPQLITAFDKSGIRYGD